MFDFLSYTFMVHALFLGVFLGFAASLLSPYLVLSHQSMIADGLSHVAFTGLVFGLIFSDQPFYFAIPFAVVASLAITYLGNIKMIEKDSAIGVVSAFSLAIGLITIHLVDGFGISIESLLVGSILTVTLSDVLISFFFLLIILSFVLLFYRPLLSFTYDKTYASFKKVKLNALSYVLSALTAVFVVIGVQSVGMLLISTFIVFPALIASQVAKSFKQTFYIGSILSIFSVVIGLKLSYDLDIPTGASIVVTYTFLLLLSILIRKLRK